MAAAAARLNSQLQRFLFFQIFFLLSPQLQKALFSTGLRKKTAQLFGKSFLVAILQVDLLNLKGKFTLREVLWWEKIPGYV